MLRHYEIYGNGRRWIGEAEALPGQLSLLAQRLQDPRDSYTDVLDEGVLVARFQARSKARERRLRKVRYQE